MNTHPWVLRGLHMAGLLALVAAVGAAFFGGTAGLVIACVAVGIGAVNTATIGHLQRRLDNQPEPTRPYGAMNTGSPR